MPMRKTTQFVHTGPAAQVVRRGGRAAGFTIIELSVVVGIALIISALVLFNNSRFNSAILLRSLAYEVGLSLREAQLYGVAVKEVTPGSGTFGAAYGVYVPATIIGVQNSTYPLFADLNNNGLYDDGPSSVVENFTLKNFFSMSNFCAVEGNGAMQCASTCPSPLPSGASSCSSSSIGWLDVTFVRPNPNAIILTSFASSLPSLYTAAYFTVTSQNGSTRTVSISAMGQIIVNNN